MKMSQSFEAAQPMAQHCPELIARGPRPEEQAETLAAWRRDLAKSLSENLGGLLSGGKMSVEVSEPEWLSGEEIFQKIGAAAANSLLRCGDTAQTMLLSVDLATAIALTDRSFGGTGAMPEQTAEQLPRSAGLLIDQAAAIIANVIAEASGDPACAGGEVIVRSESASRLKPFDHLAPCAAITITLVELDGPTWQMLLAGAKGALESLLPGPGITAQANGSSPNRSASNAAPFDHIPLPLEAVLAEFDLSLGKLDRLAPGDKIPLAMPREVPLRIGSQVFARGSIGTFEDRMALRLSRVQNEGSVQ